MSKSSTGFPGKADEILESVQETAEMAVHRLEPLKSGKTFCADNRPRSRKSEFRPEDGRRRRLTGQLGPNLFSADRSLL